MTTRRNVLIGTAATYAAALAPDALAAFAVDLPSAVPRRDSKEETAALFQRACFMHARGALDDAFETMFLVGCLGEPSIGKVAHKHMRHWLSERQLNDLPVAPWWASYTTQLEAHSTSLEIVPDLTGGAAFQPCAVFSGFAAALGLPLLPRSLAQSGCRGRSPVHK